MGSEKGAGFSKIKARLHALQKQLEEAYARGATSEVKTCLVEEFQKLHTDFKQHLKALKKELGL